MIKKFIIFLFIFFGFVANAYASSDDSMLAATVMFIKRGMITTPSWAKPIDDKKAFSQYDSKSNEIARFLICSHSSIDKYDNNGYDRLNEFYYNGGYIDLYNLDNNPKITAKFKFAGDTIYEYDNKPDKKKGILGALGFYEDGPGHLVAYAKISPDGVLTKFDAFDNKITSFKFTDNKTIKQYDANGNSIGHYKLLKYNETFPKKESTPVTKTTTTTNNTEIGIVPSIALFGQAQKIKDFSWAQNFDNTSSISYYDGYGEYAGHFNITSNSASYYNNYGNYAGGFRLSGNDVNYYDAKGNYTGRFKLSGDDINIYNAYDNYVGRLKFYNSDITYYNSQGNQIGRFKFYSSDITYYNNNGEQVGRFKF